LLLLHQSGCTHPLYKLAPVRWAVDDTVDNLGFHWKAPYFHTDPYLRKLRLKFRELRGIHNWHGGKHVPDEGMEFWLNGPPQVMVIGARPLHLPVALRHQ
jgi:hypothetical protein